MSYQQFIEESLSDASQVASKHFGKVSGTVKAGDNNQVLTQADLEIGQLLIKKVSQTYPDYNIIDEEAGAIDKGAQYTWVIDPIDGTSNFANGLPQYGVMLGLLDDGMPIAGGIALPSFNQIYAAEKGKGAFCNGEPIHVSQESELLNCLVGYGIDGHQENPQKTMEEVRFLGEIVLRIRNLRTSNSAFDFAMVAHGKYGAFLNQTSKIWDNVAPQILTEEAGGIYTDFSGKPIDYSNPLQRIEQNFTICAASPLLHVQIQEIVEKYWKKI